MNQDPLSLDDFGGLARLFPLPNLVLFPYVVQPLHIFEPRYRQLMADALDGDQLIGTALLRPGWEEIYHEKPPLYPVICVGRIIQEQQLPDGRYNLLLHGLARARIIEEIPDQKLYRTARVEVLEEIEIGIPSLEKELRQQLGDRVQEWVATQGEVLEQLKQLIQSNLPLGTLCDIFSFALGLELEVKQQLLEEVDVKRRVQLLLQQLTTSGHEDQPRPPVRKFPPDFSQN